MFPQPPPVPTADGHDTGKPRRRHIWLRKSIVLAFLSVFLACAAALVFLCLFAQQQGGLRLRWRRNHYLWTYGPTAILALVLSLWRRVDSVYRLNQPWWCLLAGRPVPSSESVLLDYTSPFFVTTFIRALRLRHYPVAASVFIFTLLKLIILASTAVFFVGPSSKPVTVPVAYTSRFSGSDLWTDPSYLKPSDQNRSELWDMFAPYQVQTGENEARFLGSDRASWAYLARLNDDMQDIGGQGAAHQGYDLSGAGVNLTSAAIPVDVFVPKITCEAATLTDDGQNSPWPNETHILYRIESATCASNSLVLNGDQVSEEHPFRTTTFKTQTQKFSPVNCTVGSTADTRYAIAMAQFTAHQVLLPKPEEAAMNRSFNTSYEPGRYAAAVCRIEYGIVSTVATHHASTGRLEFPSDWANTEAMVLPNLTNYDLGTILRSDVVRASSSLFVDTTTPESSWSEWSRYDGLNFNALFELMHAKAGFPDHSLATFSSPEFAEYAELVLEGLASEFARISLLVPQAGANVTANVTGLVIEDRLHLAPFALWTMVSAFVLGAIVCIAIILTVPESRWQLGNASSIAVHASILASSPTTKMALQEADQCRGRVLRMGLAGTRFWLDTSGLRPSLRLSEVPAGLPGALPLKMTTTRERGWIPQTARLSVVATTLAYPVLLITALEILLSFSNKREGLLDLDESGPMTSVYAIRIGSTLAVFLVATMFNNLEFTIGSLIPFIRLRQGSVPAQDSIAFSPLSKLPLTVFFQTLRPRHIGAAASYLAAMLGAFLTIAVSGLWVTTQPIAVEQPSGAFLQMWDPAGLNNTARYGVAMRELNSVRHGGTPGASLIVDNVVLPRIVLDPALSGIGGADDQNGSNYTYFGVPALRPVLDCTEVPQEDISVTFNEAGLYWSFILDTTRPSACSGGGGPEEDQIGYAVTFNSDYLASFTDLQSMTPGSRCLYSVAVVGHAPDLTALVCVQRVEELRADVTYEGDPRLDKLSKDQPPRLYPLEPEHRLRNGSFGTSALYFDIQYLTQHYWTDFPEPPTGDVDNFFYHIAAKPGSGTPYEDFTGPGPEKAYPPTRSAASRSTPPSKILLQALLGGMAVLGTIAYGSVRLRGVLPRAPYTIASVMGFLAGSQLCDPDVVTLPADLGRMTDGEARAAFEGWVFSLGWWAAAGKSGDATPNTMVDDRSAEMGQAQGSESLTRRTVGDS
ncbi:hypothetical protein PG993_008425, partial [Apiospora rasikravindrae]